MSTAPIPPSRRGWMAAALVASLLLVGLDTTMAYLALPDLMVDLPIGAVGLHLAFAGYFVVFGALLMPLRRLGEAVGQRQLLFAGLVVFGAGAVAAAFASGTASFVAARLVMGAGAAVVMPTALAVLPTLFAPAERARAVAGASAAVVIGVCLGPLLGGGLLEYFWWGSVFLVHLPVVAVALAALALPFPAAGGVPAPGATAAPADAPVDRGGWTLPVLGLVYALLMGVLFVVAPYLRGVGDAAGIGLGLRLLPLVVGLLLGVGVGERLAGRTAPRAVAAAGMALVAATLALLATVDAETGTALVAAILAAVGVGSGLALASSLRAATAAAPGDFMGVMRRTTAVRQVGAGIGVVILGVVLTTRYRDHLTDAVVDPPGAALRHLGGALATGDSGAGATQAAARLAYVDGLRTAAFAGVVLALVGVAIPLLARARAAREPGLARATARVRDFT